ncbi:MAG: hypothetical protein ACLP07_16350 [Terracidiphilus sp.]
MGSKYMFFGGVSLVLLWALSVAGAIAVLPSWTAADPEYEEGVLTRGGRSLMRARILLGSGCAVIWICTSLGHALTNSNDVPFGFWEHHPAFLQALLLLADLFLISSAFLARHARGDKPWILQLATAIMAIACISVSIMLYLL